MCITRIIFEKGIEVGTARNSVRMPTNGNTFAETFAQISQRYGVRPVLLTETVPRFGGSSRQRHSVLSLNGRDQLNVLLSSLVLPRGAPQTMYVRLLRAAINI